MNKPLSATEFVVGLPLVPMSKREKLSRLASIIRLHPRAVAMFNGIEHMSKAQMAETEVRNSAFDLAAVDPIFKDAGMQGGSAGEAKRFFELGKDELHAFSCDCGGQLSNDQMARRVEAIAASA